MEEWKNGRMEECDNSTPDSYRGENSTIEEWKDRRNGVLYITGCALRYALCAMRNKRIMDKV